MMENVTNYEDPILSSHSLFSADTKLVNLTDGSNQPLHPSAANPMLNSSPTYTALEPVYPETSLATTTSQYFGHCSSSPANLQTIYTYAPTVPVTYTDLPWLHSALYRDPDLSQVSKDEGLGSSSPSSYSSSSPPLIPSQVSAHGQTTVPSRPSSNYDYSQRSSSSSPASTVSLNYSTAPECSNCGNRLDIYWYNTHYLCRQCLPERPTVVTAPAPSPDQMNGNKRKRSSGASRNINQVCTNCDATYSKLWRRSISTGDTVCNACGLYEKLHHVPRPKSMRKDSIQTRKRKTKTSESSKSKKSPKKAAKKLQEGTVEQQQYTPNAIQYALPNYQNLQLKNLHSDFNSHPTAMIPPMGSHQSLYMNYRPELYRHDIYSPVSPNDIINVPSNMPSPIMQFANS